MSHEFCPYRLAYNLVSLPEPTHLFCAKHGYKHLEYKFVSESLQGSEDTFIEFFYELKYDATIKSFIMQKGFEKRFVFNGGTKAYIDRCKDNKFIEFKDLSVEKIIKYYDKLEAYAKGIKEVRTDFDTTDDDIKCKAIIEGIANAIRFAGLVYKKTNL